LAVGITVWGGFEKRMNKVLIVDPSKGLTAGMQISSLSKFNHVINVLSDCSCTNQSGLNTSVPDNFSGKSTKQSLTLISGLAELVESLSVGNHLKGGSAFGDLANVNRSSDKGIAVCD
jgi:hypothetical protein